MKYIISGTDRAGARTLGVSKWIQNVYSQLGETVEIIDVAKVGLGSIEKPYTDEKPKALIEAADKLLHSEGIIAVVPEYNGSYPGALKYFIDHWKFPDTYEFRPVCFVGLGGMWGGLRPVEHLQGVFSYRNAFIYPERVFIPNIWNVLKEDRIEDELICQLLEQQAKGFQNFVTALNKGKLSAKYR